VYEDDMLCWKASWCFDQIFPLVTGLQCCLWEGYWSHRGCWGDQAACGEPDWLHHVLRLHLHRQRAVWEGQAHFHSSDGLPGLLWSLHHYNVGKHLACFYYVVYYCCQQILITAKEVDSAELEFLLRFPVMANVTSPVDFLTNTGWGGIKVIFCLAMWSECLVPNFVTSLQVCTCASYLQALAAMEEFRNLDRDIEGSAKRWKKFVESECAEKEKFPQEWKNKTLLQKLCMMRALRPDRMTYAVRYVPESTTCSGVFCLLIAYTAVTQRLWSQGDCYDSFKQMLLVGVQTWWWCA